jgi:hypothetical protein
MLKGLMGIVATGFSLWVVWYEFRDSIFEYRVFLLLILAWAIFGFVLFLDKLVGVDEQTTNEKIDELIKEIRLDREQRAKEAKKDGQ